jgi:predicted permease
MASPAKIRAFVIFGIAILFCIFFIWMASRFIFHDPNSFGEGTMLLSTGGFLIVGIIILTSIRGNGGVFCSLISILIALYCFSRVTGTVHAPALSWIAGILCIVAVPIILYLTWPWRLLERMGLGDDDV